MKNYIIYFCINIFFIVSCGDNRYEPNGILFHEASRTKTLNELTEEEWKEYHRLCQSEIDEIFSDERICQWAATALGENASSNQVEECQTYFHNCISDESLTKAAKRWVFENFITQNSLGTIMEMYKNCDAPVKMLEECSKDNFITMYKYVNSFSCSPLVYPNPKDYPNPVCFKDITERC